MAISLNTFIAKYNGKQVEYHSFGTGALYQCTDLVNQYIKEVLELNPIIGTDAKDFLKKADNNYLPLANTPLFVPQTGDVVIWNGVVGGGAGHIAIVRTAGIDQFESFDQNWSQTQRCTLENHTYSNVIGFMRKKKQLIDNDTPLDKDIITDANNWRKLRATIPGIETVEDCVKLLQATGDIKTDSNNWKAIKKLFNVENVEQLTQYIDGLSKSPSSQECQNRLKEQEEILMKTIAENKKQFELQKDLLRKQIKTLKQYTYSEIFNELKRRLWR